MFHLPEGGTARRQGMVTVPLSTVKRRGIVGKNGYRSPEGGGYVLAIPQVLRGKHSRQYADPGFGPIRLRKGVHGRRGRRRRTRLHDHLDTRAYSRER